MTRKYHMVGNWKMNQSLEEIKNFFVELGKNKQELNCEAWVAPQAIHVPIVKELAFTTGNVFVGAQNCCEHENGAYTGEISPASLKDMGVHFTLIGHSERRAIYGESDELLNAKTKTALNNDLTVIFCIGETLEQRESGLTENVVKMQLDKGLVNLPKDKLSKLIIAYEPVWAIGTGKTATPEQAEEVHAFIRKHIGNLGLKAEETVILYGGSMKPDNVDGLLACENIDGGLVGGASLKGDSFTQLCLSASRASL